MRIWICIKGERGVCCLESLLESGEKVVLAVLQSQPEKQWYQRASDLAREYGVPIVSPEDPNAAQSVTHLSQVGADVAILAGYGHILAPETIARVTKRCLNLHGGELPAQRGAAPLNWALIKGRSSFGISIIELGAGIDTGPVLAREEFPIRTDNTIADLHAMANRAFPELVREVLNALRQGTLAAKEQDPEKAAYYPARFPDDGLILFDQLTARQVHDMVRALSDPYPGAYTYFKGRKVLLLASRPCQSRFYGTPGRIYRIEGSSLLVCASDRALWIDKAVHADDGRELASQVARYDRLASAALAAERILSALQEAV